ILRSHSVFKGNPLPVDEYLHVIIHKHAETHIQISIISKVKYLAVIGNSTQGGNYLRSVYSPNMLPWVRLPHIHWLSKGSCRRNGTHTRPGITVGSSRGNHSTKVPSVIRYQRHYRGTRASIA